MSIDPKTRERILRAVADVRQAAAKHRANSTDVLNSMPAKTREKHGTGTLNLMLPRPHTSIW